MSVERLTPSVIRAVLSLVLPPQPAGMFQEAESLLCCERWPDAHQLLPLAQQHLPCICDTKAVDEDSYYKTNTHKVCVCVCCACACVCSWCVPCNR